MHAWVDADGDPDAKSSYRFPHHAPGADTAANLAGVRNALSRLSQSDISDADRSRVEAHLRRHLEDADRNMEASMADFERRFTSYFEMGGQALVVELRAKEQMRIGGYAAVFNRLSQNLGGFVEKVAPGFFNKSRGDGWPRVSARYNHDSNMILGTTGSGTLRLSVDDVGLDYEVDLPNSRADIAELVGRGDVRQSSFAFRVFEDEWDTTDQNFPMRILHSGQLVDVAPVNDPAYIETTAAFRSFAVHFAASPEEVRAAVDADDLRRFFTKTGKNPPPKKTLGPQARAFILGRQQDPWAETA